MLYNYNVIITYNYYDSQFIEFNKQQNIDLSIIDAINMTTDVSDYLYKQELLAVFDLTEFDENVINSKIIELCELMSKNEEFAAILTLAAGKVLSEELCVGFMFLFSYHSFFLIHRCICDFLTNNSIHLSNLKSIV